MERFSSLEKLNRRVGTEKGQTMSEYAVVLLVISATVVAAFGLLSSSVASRVANVVGLLP